MIFLKLFGEESLAFQFLGRMTDRKEYEQEYYTILKLMADGPSFLYEKLVRESWYKKFVHVSQVFVQVFSCARNFDELEQCSILYEKLGVIVIKMLCRYWLEVRFVYLTIFCCLLLLVVSSVFVFLGILLIIECYPETNKI